MKERNLRVLVISVLMLFPFGVADYKQKTETDFVGCTEGEDLDQQIIEETCSIEEENQDVVNNSTSTNNSTVTSSPNSTNNSTVTSETDDSEMNPGEGVQENQTILNFNALIHYPGENWSDFQFHSMFDYEWNNTINSTAKWTVVFFLSTDCGHCWHAADEISHWSQTYSNSTNFLAIAVNFSSNNNFNATQEEVVAFQQQTNYTGCVGGNYNCADRPGSPHEFGYVDDRNQTIMRDWGVGGTPKFFIIQPNGVVAWNQYQHNNGDGENIEQALQRFFGE